MRDNARINDFQRFLFVLLIMSSYLYAGIVIEAYVRQQTEHLTYLSTLMLICLAGACWFQFLIVRERKED